MSARSIERRCAFWLTPAIVAACLSLLPPTSQALSWEYVPQVAIGGTYESNPGYSGDNEENGYAASMNAALYINGETERTRVTIEPRVDGDYFGSSEEDKDQNSLNFFLPASFIWSEQRATYGLEGGYSYISSNDFEVTDPNQPPVSGQYSRIRVNDDQEQFFLSPSASFQVTPRDVLAVSLSATDVNFDDAGFTGRTNYNNFGARTSWSRALDIQARITASAYVARYDGNEPSRRLPLTVDDLARLLIDNPFLDLSRICIDANSNVNACEVDNETTTYGVDAGYEYAWTSNTTIGITAGVAHSDIEVSGWSSIDTDGNPFTPPLPCFDADQQVFISCTLKTSDETFIGRLFFDRRTGNTITTGFSVSRAVQPSSDGAVVNYDVANAYLTKEFSRRLNGRLGASYIKQEAVGKESAEVVAARFDVRYLRLDADLSWSLTRTWSIGVGYHFTRDEQTGFDTVDVDNHTISVLATYSGIGRR